MGLLLFVGVLALHQAAALRILSCLHRLPSQPHKLAEEISHSFLFSCETSLPLPFQASPISASQHWSLPDLSESVLSVEGM